MNVVGITDQVPAESGFVSKPSGVDYIHLYDEPPTMDLSLDQFELYALKRLKVLRKVERMVTFRNSNAEKELGKIIREELTTPEIDTISHFILRAAYSLDEEKRRWFLKHETELFKLRLDSVTTDRHKQLAKSLKMLQLTPLSPTEQQEKIQQLTMLLPKKDVGRNKNHVFYKVPFTHALDLVAKRQCIVERGFAFIPSTKIISILAGKFRMHLSASLAHLAQHGIFPGGSSCSEEDRLYPLLKNINSCLLDSEQFDEGIGGLQSSQVTAANVANLVKHMPLCMRTMQIGLKQDKKLRYHGRLQYGLFLKGAGLSLEESMQFFQKSFSNMTPEQFQKEYAYNIRHTFGKEGQNKSKSAYSCSGIINSPAPSNTGDHHGCPYKNYDTEKLSKLLQSLKIGTPGDRTDIVNLKKANHYGLACLQHFKVMHPNAETMDIPVDNVGNHPNAWFRASMAFEEKENAGVKVE